MTSVVEETYEGPRWEEGEIAVEFMTGLLDWLKDEKKLHRKYAYKVRQGWCPDSLGQGRGMVS